VLIKAARIAHQMRTAHKYGLTDTEPNVDFRRVIEHVHNIREDVFEEADRPELYEQMGVTVQHGRARFVDAHTIEIDGEAEQRISSRYIVIATGSSAFIPPISGLSDTAYLTNETLFEIDALPRRLAVIGAGPIGIEMAQSFRRLGAEVVVFDMLDRIMAKDDPELAGLMKSHLESEGIRFVLNARVQSVAETASGKQISVKLEGGQTYQAEADAILVAAGRRPKTRDLNLEAAGVEYDKTGIKVNNKGRTSVRHIYACGDVTGGFQFTHMSEHTAKVAVSNALLKLPMKIDTRHVPWCTYTDPELAHVGATEEDLMRKGTSYEVYRFPYSKIDRAITEGDTHGWIKVFAKKLTGKILGVSILGRAAGEQIGEYALAMRNGVTLRNIADTIHPYPTYALGSRRAADQWYVRNQSLMVVKLIRTLFQYRGPLPDLSDPNRIM
jgi:pyruvate/2-oxoglutarate dehydrogenase complex dihydrolipoamide dehydrogenase (E3) component